MEPENHLFEKEKNIFQTFIFRFYYNFSGVEFLGGILVLKSYLMKFSLCTVCQEISLHILYWAKGPWNKRA